jgi:hypothetical protein
MDRSQRTMADGIEVAGGRQRFGGLRATLADLVDSETLRGMLQLRVRLAMQARPRMAGLLRSRMAGLIGDRLR